MHQAIISETLETGCRGILVRVIRLQQQQHQHMSESQGLPGYERDINDLIDLFAIQAHKEQVISFSAFKTLFNQRCCAYIHQAYWGCEHSPEYVQLLFAVALDRLDIPSPTAPPNSALWQLHQLVPMGSLGCTSTALTADSTGQDHQHVLPAGQHMPAVDPTGSAADPVEAMDVELAAEEGHQQPAVWAAQPPGLQAGGQQPVPGMMQQAWPPSPAAAPQLQPLQQEEQVLQGTFDPHLPQAEPHLSQQGLQDQADQQLQQWMQESGEQQMQQQPGQQQSQPAASPPAGHSCVSSELQQHAFAAQPEAMSPTDPLSLLLSPLPSPLLFPMEQHCASPGGSPGLEGLGDFEELELEDLELELEELSSPAVAAAGQQQQQTDPQPQQPQDLLPQQQQQQQPDAAGGVQQWVLQEQQLQPAGDAQLPPPLPQQQYDMPMGQLDHYNYVGTLVDILDRGAPGELQQEAALTAGMTDVPQGSGQDGVHSALPDAQTGREQVQQQHVMKVPLAVKGAVVFTLLALHESQLIYPKVPVYVPLPLLQQLACAAAEFKAASPAAADALQALQLLVSGQRLLVGQFRRPNNWEPQLPADLMPGGRMPAGMGLNAAIGAAARKAARSAAKSSMQSAAVAAAARAARAAAAFDPGVHREAVFHIKSALRGLSNFSSMQSLCDQYAAARRAIFGPLLEGQHAASGTEQQQCSSAVQPQRLQEPAADKEHAGQAGNQGPLIVKRGGSRRKRLAAAAAPGRKGKAKGVSLAAPIPAPQQPEAPAEAPAPSAPLAAGLDLPEVFDAKFASSLQDLANSEASRMLLLLDPYYSASKVRKRTAAEKQAAKAAEAAASAAAKSRLERFQRLTMSRAGAGNETSTGQHEQARSMAAAPEEQGVRHELAAAGVFTEQELEDVASSSLLAVSGAGMPGMQQALQRAAQQRQEKAQVAKAWLQAERALVLDDDDEDMP